MHSKVSKEIKVLRYMPYKLFHIFLIFLLFILVKCIPDMQKDGEIPLHELRVISLSPAITDLIIELGFSDNLIAVTDYCQTIDSKDTGIIGTLLDINLEKILLLSPDMIFLSPYHSAIFPKLRELKINYMSIPLDSISDIKEGISILGKYFQNTHSAHKLIDDLNETIIYYTEISRLYEDRTVLLIIGDDLNNYNSFYAVGRGNFLNEILHILNCKNPLDEFITSFPLISLEELFSLNPDIIIELYADRKLSETEKKNRILGWNKLHRLKAVENSQVFLINELYILRPSTKIIHIIHDIYNIINQ